MKKIVMPKPCSEDWSKMTPTEKGAYCAKCELEVMDFTNKSSEEIRDVMMANIGKRTCGHISKSQLEIINSDYHLWENQSIPVFQSKFLYACVMVFGMALFTGCDYLNGEQHHDVGEIEQVDTGKFEEVVDGGMMVIDDSTASCSSDDALPGQMMVEGEMVIEDDPEVE